MKYLLTSFCLSLTYCCVLPLWWRDIGPFSFLFSFVAKLSIPCFNLTITPMRNEWVIVMKAKRQSIDQSLILCSWSTLKARFSIASHHSLNLFEDVYVNYRNKRTPEMEAPVIKHRTTAPTFTVRCKAISKVACIHKETNTCTRFCALECIKSSGMALIYVCQR